MLHLVLGRAGSGKSSYLRELLYTEARKGNEKLILIVPEQFSFVTERTILSDLSPKEAARIQIMQFNRMADDICRAYGGIAHELLSDTGKVVLMMRALEGVQDQLSMFRRQVGNLRFVSGMLKTSEEMKRGCVNPDLLLQMGEGEPSPVLSRKLKEIGLITGMYDALVCQRFCNASDILDILYDILGEHPFFQDHIVVFDAFAGFTEQELRIMGRIFAQAQDVYIALPADSMQQVPGDTGPFASVKRTAAALVRLAKEVHVPVSAPVELGVSKRFRNGALAALEQNLFVPAPQVFAEETDDVVICEAPNMQEECDYIARTIKAHLRTGDVRCRDISILVRDLEHYQGSLQTALKKYGIPVYEDDRRPVFNQPLMLFVYYAFRIALGGFRTDDILCYLKTGLTGLSAEDCARLENYVLIWKVNGRKWLSPFDQHPRGFANIRTDADDKLLAHLNQLREQAIMPLSKFRAKLQSSQTARDIAGALFRHLESVKAPVHLQAIAKALEAQGELASALAQKRIWELLISILDQTVETLGETPIQAERYAEVLQSVIQLQDIGEIPQGMDEVSIGSVDRARTNYPKLTFVAGVNEGVFPQIPTESGLFSKQDKQRLMECGVEIGADSERMYLEERLYAYNAFASPSDKLYLTYACQNTEEDELRPSGLIAQVREILPHCKVTASEPKTLLDAVESKAAGFEYLAKHWHTPSRETQTLKTYYSAQPQYAGALEMLAHAASQAPLRIASAAKAKALFGNTLFLSASRVEEYYRCAFQYFCKFGMRALPRRVAELDPMQSGSVVHYVLEQMLRAHPAAELGGMPAETRMAEIRALLERYLIEEMGTEPEQMPKRFLHLYRNLAGTIDAILCHMAEEFAQSQFQPEHFELNIDRDGDIEPYELKLEDGGMLLLRGKVDRVDVMREDGKTYLRVVDYKSGEKKFELADVLSGLNMQMLIYLRCLSVNGETLYNTPAPAGILYMPAKRKTVSGARDMAAEKIRDKQRSDLKMNGLLLEDEAVLRGMEQDLKGRYIPAKRSAKGALSGSLIAAETLGRLFSEIDAKLREMGNSLHAGEIDARPASGKRYDVCKYCDYGAVCKRKGTEQVRKVADLKLDEAITQLEAGESDGSKA